MTTPTAANMSPENTLAYGVDPTRRERYSLRQARYHALGETIGQLLASRPAGSPPLKVLDIGVWNGVLMRYVEAQAAGQPVEFHGVDLTLQPTIYCPERWQQLTEANLCDGLPLPSDTYDVVVCEQVLEHLPQIDVAMAALSRVLRPGGLLIVGVPIFPEGIHLVRKHVVPLIDRLTAKKKPRGHLQAFSRRTFISALKTHGGLQIHTSRGFRVISGGLLRRLENHRWWWQLNRFLGRVVPGLCTEIQVLATKAQASSKQAHPTADRRAA